jgi:hypothetical protein
VKYDIYIRHRNIPMWKNYIVYDIAKKVRYRIRCRTSHRTYDWQEWGISPTMSYVFALIVRFDVRHRTFYVRHRTSHRIRYRTCDWQEWGNIVYDVGIFQRCRTSGHDVVYDVKHIVYDIVTIMTHIVYDIAYDITPTMSYTTSYTIFTYTM